jgi:hypothetical protein
MTPRSNFPKGTKYASKHRMRVSCLPHFFHGAPDGTPLLFLLYQKTAESAIKIGLFLQNHYIFCEILASFVGLSIDKRLFFSYNI